MGKIGEMAERSKAAVLKTVEGNPLPGFESLSLRQNVRLIIFNKNDDYRPYHTAG